MKATLLSLALTFSFCVAVPAFAQNASQDTSKATHDTKTASEKGYNKTTGGVKKGYKKSTHATKKGVHKAADKVSDKTSPTE